MSQCQSCGQDMPSPLDHGGGDEKNRWCRNCCHPGGDHMSRAEIIAGISKWLLSDECPDAGFLRANSQREARSRAEDILRGNPAWGSAR